MTLTKEEKAALWAAIRAYAATQGGEKVQRQAEQAIERALSDICDLVATQTRAKDPAFRKVKSR